MSKENYATEINKLSIEDKYALMELKMIHLFALVDVMYKIKGIGDQDIMDIAYSPNFQEFGDIMKGKVKAGDEYIKSRKD